jgi:acetyl esterase/lipase
VSASRLDPAAPWDVSEDDVEYARPDGTPLLARVYRPVGAPGRRPALVDVHGGAWSSYDRTVDAYYDRALAASGLVVVALDFRQGPAHRHPAAVRDVVAGVRWVQTRAETLGVTADDVGLVGGSSGGHLAMLAAVCPGRFGCADARVAYALPLWAIVDPIGRYRYLLGRRGTPAREPFFQPERLMAGHHAYFADEATMHEASVVRVLDAGEAEHLPPIWAAHAERDENVTLPMTEAFVAAYRRAGGQAELEVFPGVGHAFANLPGAAADHGIARMRAFIARRV